MIGKIPPQNPQSNRPIPSEEVKKNKSKTLVVGGPILEQRIPNSNMAKEIYAVSSMPHKYENQTGAETKAFEIANKRLKNIWAK